jgi:hypothetical protein
LREWVLAPKPRPGHPVSRMPRVLILLAFAAVFGLGCSGEESEAPHLPQSVQRQLPIELTLGNLCPGAETPRWLVRDLRRRAEVLLRELRERPDFLVTDIVYYEDGEEERQIVTVRELAERQLLDLREGRSDLGECSPDIQRRLDEALS